MHRTPLARILPALLVLLLLSGCGLLPAGPRPLERPVSVAVVTDIHYTGPDYLYTAAFAQANEQSGSGKQVELLPQLLDAFLEEMLEKHPDVLLITGDNAFNGARVSHEALIQKLESLRRAGILVLTLPGNHDLESRSLVFPEGEPVEAPSVTAEEFARLYADYGYGGALSQDPNSLSYVYDSGLGVRFFLLDTIFRYGSVYGRVEEDTLQWLEWELKACRKAGDIPVVAGHHNLLTHNPLFTFEYTIDTGEQLRQLMADCGASLFLSGHLHVQSIAEKESVTDIATESFAVYPHRWGLVTLDGLQWSYEAQATDVSAWAARQEAPDPRLPDYEAYGRDFLYRGTWRIMENSLAAVEDEELKARACDQIAEINVAYFTGTPQAAPGPEVLSLLEQAGDTFFPIYLHHITDLPPSLTAQGVFGKGT